MQPQPDREFNDPVLKDAVRRCWSCDCAPSELQKKIASLCASSDANEHQKPLGKLSWVIWPMAIAASLVLAVGFFHRFENHPAPLAIAPAIPVSLENDLIFRHDRCCIEPNHQHVNAPKNDDAAIENAMHQQLNRPVLVFHPQDRKWDFRGASICPVGSVPAGHLVFVKGKNALSIFSLPKSFFPDAVEGKQYAVATDKHCIVGFVKDGAFFCLVSSGDVSVGELQKMEPQMLPAISRSFSPHPEPILLTELLRPIHQ
jgi:hypothetical protein